MSGKFIILVGIFVFSVYGQTIAWEGVSDLGGGGIGYSSGSQTVTPYGSSSSSSQSSFSTGGPVTSTPQSNFRVYSSEPINIRTTSTPVSLSSGTNSAQQMANILGDWVITSVGAQRTNIPSSFSSNSFNLDYCAPLSYSYQTQSSNGISFSSRSSSNPSCGSSYSSYPSFGQLQNTFGGVSSYAYAGDNLNLRNSQGNVLATLSRPVAIASAGGATAIAAAPLPTTTSNVYPINTNSAAIGTTSTFQNTVNIASPLVGSYRVISVNNYPVNFNVTIDDSQIRYQYCNSKRMSYTTSGSTLTVTPGVSTLMACSNQYPT
jgi:heat shock protein HslJ